MLHCAVHKCPSSASTLVSDGIRVQDSGSTPGAPRVDAPRVDIVWFDFYGIHSLVSPGDRFRWVARSYSVSLLFLGLYLLEID
jgi:hypothetical protein